MNTCKLRVRVQHADGTAHDATAECEMDALKDTIKQVLLYMLSKGHCTTDEQYTAYWTTYDNATGNVADAFDDYTGVYIP